MEVEAMDKNTFLVFHAAQQFLSSIGYPISELTLRKYSAQGKITCYKPSLKRVLFKPADLVAFVESRRVAARER